MFCKYFSSHYIYKISDLNVINRNHKKTMQTEQEPQNHNLNAKKVQKREEKYKM